MTFQAHKLTLDSIMEKALIKGIRKQKFNKYRKERDLFNSGLEKLSVSNKYRYTFIKHNFLVLQNFDLIDHNSLLEINNVFETLHSNLNDYSFNLKLSFECEDNCTCDSYYPCHCSEEPEPKALISKEEFTFSTIKDLKREIKGSISYCVRDAKHKLHYQKGGKDSLRYLNIIENNL